MGKIKQFFKNKSFIEILPWIWLVVSYCLTFIYIYFKGRNYIDSDMAGEMILSDLLNKEGGILSRSWYYSTELRIFYLQIFYRLTLLLFPNHWWAARVAGQALWIATLLLSYFFLCGRNGLNLKNHGVLGAACLACPFSIWYFWYGAYGGFYVPHMILLLISLGLIVRTVKADNNKKIIIYGFLLALVCFINGLGSVKGLMALYVPMCLASLLLLLYKMHNNPNGKHAIEKKLLIVSIIVLIISSIGYLINSKILVYKYSVAIDHGRTWGELNLNNFTKSLSQFLSLLGNLHPGFWDTKVDIFSLSGLLGSFSYVTVFLLIFSVIILFKKRNSLDTYHLMIYILFLSVILVQGSVFAFTTGPDSINASYWLTPLPLVFPIIDLGFTYFDYKYKMENTILVLTLMISISSTSIASVDTYFKKSLRSVPELKEVFEYLDYSDLTQGYASFWNADVLT